MKTSDVCIFHFSSKTFNQSVVVNPDGRLMGDQFLAEVVGCVKEDPGYYFDNCSGYKFLGWNDGDFQYQYIDFLSSEVVTVTVTELVGVGF